MPGAQGWSSPAPVGGFGAAAVAGFDPVGQVFGTTVAYLNSVGPWGFGRCFAAGPPSRSERSTADPANPLLGQLYAARKRAFDRAVEECRALGGDGMIGVRLSSAAFFTNTVEFTVEGTAVRARSDTRPAAPFTTHVSGQDLARLLHARWMPFALVFGLAVAACHFDESMFQQTSRGVGAAGNREVSGYTRLVGDARREARRTFADAVRDKGGEGAVVQEMTLRYSERECPETGQRFDYMVEAMIVGSALVSFERSGRATQRPAPLTIMRLDGRAAPVPDPQPRSGGGSAGASLGDRAFAYWTARRAARPTDSP